MKVSKTLLRYISPEAPREIKLRVAARTEPESLKLAAEDQMTALFVLSYEKDGEVAEAARASFAALDQNFLISALDKKLDPAVIRKAVDVYRANDAVLTMAALNPHVDNDTVCMIAEIGPEEVIALLVEDKKMFLDNPGLLPALKKNPLAPAHIIDEIKGFMANPASGPAAPEAAEVRGAKAQLVPREMTEEGPDEAPGDKHNIYSLIKDLSVGQKIKFALTGNKTAREFLVRSSNKVVVSAVLKNPRITEDEVLRAASSKNTSDDALRQIGRHNEWMKNYNMKLVMVMNPKTPVSISLKLLDSIYEKDLASVAKSKNIPSVLASAARRRLDMKTKKGG
ncbi:MAG: hypothetical protein HZB83_02815 [Deltaproteobacteria bacterium]|nr:hypothetical protein [Deltaproteobacteria bacterium]